MKRLTFVDEDGQVLFDNPAVFPEDVGFTIRELAENGEWEALDNIAERLANCEQRLKHYEDLEEQGKLLKLLCAVGDTVYRVHKRTKLSPDRVYECKVVGVKQEYNTMSVKLHANINEETYSIWVDNWFDKCQIGNEFFLTEEEAEAALKEWRT